MPGGAAFWAGIANRRDLAEGRLMGSTRQSADWDHWERHPAGDEILVLLSGSASNQARSLQEARRTGGHMTLVVRLAQPSDESALVDQFQGLNVHENGITKDRRTDYSAAQESLAAAWQSVHQTDGQVLVAELDGRVIGHLFLLFKIDAVFVERELRPYAYVSELYVTEKVRGRGVARALMNEAERIAKGRGLPRILVGVVAGNKEAEALYGRLGYAPYIIELTKNL